MTKGAAVKFPETRKGEDVAPEVHELVQRWDLHRNLKFIQMAKNLSMESKLTIGQKLLELGFSDIGRMLEDGQRVSGGLLISDDTHSSEDVRFSILFKLSKDQGWILERMDASIQFLTSMRQEGVEVLTVVIDAINEAVPSRLAVLDMLMVKMESYKMHERVVKDPNLKDEFMAMGFNEIPQMLQKVQHHNNLTFLRTDRPVDMLNGAPGDKIKFEFIVSSPKGGRTPHVGMVKAFLSIVGENEDQIARQSARTFGRVNGIMPTIEHMTSQVLSSVELKNDLFDRVKAMFKMDSKDGFPNESLHLERRQRFRGGV